MSRCLLWLFLVGCASKDPVVSLEALAEQPPTMPAPEAAVYARGAGKVTDIAVSELAKDLQWDEALSGAAGALAMGILNGDEPSRWAARWAAYRAGYPHNLLELRVYRAEIGVVPEALRTDLVGLEASPAGTQGLDVGLARSRGYELDTWVLLTAEVSVEVQPFARQVEVGETVELSVPTPERIEALWVSPSGFKDRVSLSAHSSFTLSEEGEWWLELSRVQENGTDAQDKLQSQPSLLLTVPVMVGFEAPEFAPLSDWNDLGGVLDGLTALRQEFDVSPPSADPILESVARASARALIEPSASPQRAVWAPGPEQCGAVLQCVSEEGASVDTGKDVRQCFESWIVDGVSRAALVDARCDLIGISKAETASQGTVTIVVLGQSQ